MDKDELMWLRWVGASFFKKNGFYSPKKFNTQAANVNLFRNEIFLNGLDWHFNNYVKRNSTSILN